MSDFAGLVAVITGAGSGLGAALARRFAGVGMDIAVLDIDESAAASIASSITADTGVATTSFRVDVGDAASVAAGAVHVRSTLGGCDVLCSNVGVQQFGAVDRLTEQDWSWVMNVNVLGTVRTVGAFLPMLRERSGWRRIVLTASSSVLAPSVRMAAYQTSKFAVMGYGESLREELKEEGIGVTIMFPGGMMTSHLDSSVRARPRELGTSTLDVADIDAMLAHLPMSEGDLATPEHAIRNLLADLDANEPYVLTHGSYRPIYESRLTVMKAAFDRMEKS